MENNIYINLQITPITKLGLLSKLQKKVHKIDIANLINSINDEKLINTLRYVYVQRGDILPQDLIIIKNAVNKILDQHYDQKIRGIPTNLNAEQVETMEKSIEQLQHLINKYYPQLTSKLANHTLKIN